MAYGLGIDLGTSCTVAAIRRADTEDIRPEVVALGAGAPGVPTVLHVADDATMLVGAAAEPLVLSEPERVFRGFLHHVGEPSASGPELRPAALTARLVRWVVETVAEREGGPAEQITLCHPASLGPDECCALHDALSEFGLPGVMLVPAPVAVATYAATESDVRDPVAVYDLGATFSASVVGRESAGFVLLGKPHVLEDGGGRFDEVVLARVLDELGDQVATPDLDDPAVLAGMAALLTDCVAARETLSDRPEVVIPVSLPDLQAEVRLTRDELETLVLPTLRATVTRLYAAISAAALTPADIGTVEIAGGCARMPQVARLLAAEFGRPVAVFTDPELAAARGAALLAAPPPIAAPLGAPAPTTPLSAAPPSTAEPLLPKASPVPDLFATTANPTLAYPTLADPTLADPPPRPHSVAPADPPSAGSRVRPGPRTLLAFAAGLLAVATIALPLTLFRTSDSGAEPSTFNHGDPGRGDRAPAYGGAGAPLFPGGTSTTDSGPASIPTPPPGPLTVPRLQNAPGPASFPPTTRRADTGSANPAPRPSPAPTSAPPPISATPPPPTSATTSPPTSATTSPPTSATTSPPTSATTSPPVPTSSVTQSKTTMPPPVPTSTITSSNIVTTPPGTAPTGAEA